MKLTLIFLSAMLAITHQQYYHPLGLTWFSPQQIAKSYQLFNYNSLQDGIPIINQYRSSKPIHFYQNDEKLNQGLMTDTKRFDDENDDANTYSDAQARIKSFKNPALYAKQNPRIFLFGSASTYTNPFFKTATFTLTSTVNITSVQVCVPSTVFTAGATTCRRKRRDIDLAWMDEPGYDQFYIAPTETRKVEPTMVPADFVIEENHHHIPNTHHGLTSSKQETIVDESETQNGNKKQKRFVFNQYVVSTTITSYTFQTTFVTKTANLASSASALCRPAGYINC